MAWAMKCGSCRKPGGNGAVQTGMVAALGALALCGTVAAAAPSFITIDPTLALVRSKAMGPVMTGEVVTVEVRMRDLVGNEAAGFQAFLEFDGSLLSFVSGTYTPAPFGLPIIDPIVADGTNIDLAAGIDVFIGQAPTSADEVLAELTFVALAPSCAPAVTFRKHDPPTRLTTAEGDPIVPLQLVNPIRDCACDWNCDGLLNSQDFFDYVIDFFAGNGEFNQDGVHNSQDFFDFLICFFAPGPNCS